MLEPYSDARRVLSGFRDGVDRFAMHGPIAPFKHAILRDYAERVDLSACRIASGRRKLFSRALTAYFWFREADAGWVLDDPVWSAPS